MNTLRIQHPIKDYPTWRQAFDRFAGLRQKAGVRAFRVARPVDDPLFVLIDLDFDTADAAGAFEQLLRTRVWSRPENSPALDGDPVTRILSLED